MRSILTIWFYFFVSASALCQGLEELPPVLTQYKCRDTGTSFLLNTLDWHRFRNEGHSRYYNTIQIVDADVPWPPRWFVSQEIFDNDSVFNADKINLATRVNVMMDARFSGDELAFYKERSVTMHDKKSAEVAGYIICDKNLQAVDTVKNTDEFQIDYHDFRLNSRKERLMLLKVDTVLDLRKSTGNPSDAKVSATINIIEVLDSANRVLFVWDPVKALGANSMYYRYRNTITYVSSKKQNIDWSHGTSVSWDFDGNILYSFRFIGIGKIDAKDGHVIWRLDRNKMPVISGKDTVEFYSQHDFEKLEDNDQYTTYSLFSNGDDQHPNSYVLIFKVDKRNGRISTERKIKPVKRIFSNGWGSFESDENGNYLLNYGQCKQDSMGDKRGFLEYVSSSDKTFSMYRLPDLVYSYKVHFVKHNRSPRPLIISYQGKLSAKGAMNEWTWYKLSGKENAKAEKAGVGPSFIPSISGIYCVVGRYGVGFSCSLPIDFTK